MFIGVSASRGNVPRSRSRVIALTASSKAPKIMIIPNCPGSIKSPVGGRPEIGLETISTEAVLKSYCSIRSSMSSCFCSVTALIIFILAIIFVLSVWTTTNASCALRSLFPNPAGITSDPITSPDSTTSKAFSSVCTN